MPRTVLTTGANSGIGMATVLELARRGYRAVGSVRSDEKGLLYFVGVATATFGTGPITLTGGTFAPNTGGSVAISNPVNLNGAVTDVRRNLLTERTLTNLAAAMENLRGCHLRNVPSLRQ